MLKQLSKKAALCIIIKRLFYCLGLRYQINLKIHEFRSYSNIER